MQSLYSGAHVLPRSCDHDPRTLGAKLAAVAAQRAKTNFPRRSYALPPLPRHHLSHLYLEVQRSSISFTVILRHGYTAAPEVDA
jgi:hypothetical protein